MKERTKKSIRGAISVLLVIILLPMMTLSAVIVDSSRINMGRAMVSSAGDLTMNAALAEYDTILKDVYGLFAMSQDKSDEDLAKELKQYFQKTLVSYGVTTEEESGAYVQALIGDFNQLVSGVKNGSISSFVDMDVGDDFKMVKVPESSLSSPGILRSQIVEYMKYRAPINFGMSFLDSIKAFKNVQDQTAVVEKQVAAQESTQDVTKACSNTINEIRAYDELIHSIQEGSKAVKGLNEQKDALIVHLENYHEQVDKYRENWADNYRQTNKINLVFLANAPSVDSIYLHGLKYANSEYYIFPKVKGDSTTYTLNINNSGISVNPSLASNTSSAKAQVEQQISKLESGEERTTAEKYRADSSFRLKDSYISLDYTHFKDEEKAINSFIAFERFLLDDSAVDLKYSDVKKTLEQIAILSKYYDNYSTKINQDIAKADQEKRTADNAVTAAERRASALEASISSDVTAINDANGDWNGSLDFLIGVKNSGRDMYSVISSLVLESDIVTPFATKGSNGRQFVRYDGFLTSTYGGDSADNKYLRAFRDLVSSLSGKSDYAGVCAVAASYMSDRSSGKTAKSFKDYVKDISGKKDSENKLTELLNLLYENHVRVSNMEKSVREYDGIYNDYAQIKNNAIAKATALQRLQDEQKNVKARFGNCLSWYDTFGRYYQSDVYYYDRYIRAAKNVVGASVRPISAQFKQIQNNVDSIIKKLESIEGKLDTARSAIEAYNRKIGEWEKQNNSYTNKTSGDSFSSQNEADIKASKTQYDIDSLDTLKTYVRLIKEEYQDFYSRLTDGIHFKYGKTKIIDITSADQATAALEDAKASMPQIITVETAESQFPSLYNAEPTTKIMQDELQNRYYFLEPTVLPTPFLRYLNQAYPRASSTESASTSSESGGSAKSETKEEGQYKNAKNNLKKDSGNVISNDDGGAGNSDKYGYTYKTRSVGSDLPSNNMDGKTGNTKGFQATGEDDDINVSSSFSSQSSALSSVLGGIENVATNALENSYVLAYVFDNFSYNTIVQERVIDGEKVRNYPAAITALNGDINKYLNKSTSLSNFGINGNNNHLYGAEVEYILYGNSNPSTNVTYAKGSIYAVRFGFNCIYAFTNSEIRSETMSVGLAVQAATLGFVPYQLVQIVLQLALAAAESGLDLDMMAKGMKVAVVKSNDTWQLSLSNAIQTVGELASNEVVQISGDVIDQVSSGLQELVDAGADEINQSVTNLESNLGTATENKAREVIDASFNYIESSIEKELNELLYIDYEEEKTTVPKEINKVFDHLRTSLPGELEAKFSDNPVAQQVLPHVLGRIDGILNGLQGYIDNQVAGLSPEQANEVIISKMGDIKQQMIQRVDLAVEQTVGYAVGVARDLTESVRGQLNDCISEVGDSLSEEAANQIKENAANITNSFIDSYLDGGGNMIGGGIDGVSGAGSSSVSSMLKFGYKDYLMLFTFIALCVDSSATTLLIRVSDVIQMNISNGSANGAEFVHKKGTDFRMKNAETYISMHSSVDLQMLFMNWEFFGSVLQDDNTEVKGQLTPAAKIVYNGLYGY